MRWSSINAFLALVVSSQAIVTPFVVQEDQATFAVDGPVRTTDKWEYKDCGEANYPVQIESIEVSPDPPQPGKDLTVKVKAIVLERIEEGAYADVVVKVGLIKLLEKTFDVCEEARNANATVQCPVEPGAYEIEETVALPKEIPKAKFTVNVNAYTVDDDDMLCLRLLVDFIKNPFPRPRRFW